MPAPATAPESAIFQLRPDGCIATWNDQAARLLGYSSEEALDRYFAWFSPIDEVQRGESERELRLARARGHLECDGWRHRKDGSRFWAHVAIEAIRSAAGELEGFALETSAG